MMCMPLVFIAVSPFAPSPHSCDSRGLQLCPFPALKFRIRQRKEETFHSLVNDGRVNHIHGFTPDFYQ